LFDYNLCTVEVSIYNPEVDLNEYISNYNKQTEKEDKKDNSALSRIYNKLEEKEKRVKKQSNIFVVKKLEIKHSKTIEKRDKDIEKKSEMFEKREKNQIKWCYIEME